MLKSGIYNILLLLTMFAFGSGISISSQFSAFLLLIILLLLLNVLILAFGQKELKIPSMGYTDFFISVFIFIIFYTMLIRGIGFEALGSNKSGGIFYIKLFSVLLFFVLLVRIKASDQLIIALFFSFFISCLLPFFSDVLYLINGGETLFHKIVPGSTTIQFYAEKEDSLLRIQSAAQVAEYIVVLMLPFYPIFTQDGKLKFNKVNSSILIIALILIGLSGHRITLIGISLLFIFYYSSFFGLKKLYKPLLIGAGIFVAVCIFAILQFEHLPSNFQRSFSFLPFTPTNDVTLDASASLDFRVLMAAKALVMLPDYYLIGKGFAFINYDVSISDFFGTIDLFAEIGVFHNGLIGLLINLGIPGLLIGLCLLFSIRKFIIKKEVYNQSSVISQILVVLKCKILVSIIYFFFLYGDVQTNFLEIVMLASLYKFVYFSFRSKAIRA